MNVFFSIDNYSDVALYTTINSILSNSTKPNDIIFNILVSSNIDNYVLNLVKYFKNNKFNVKEFNSKIYPDEYNFLKNNIDKINEGHVHKNMMNYARIFLPYIFYNVEKGIYLDTDIIVQKDLFDLYNIELSQEFPCASPLIRGNYHMEFSESIPDLNININPQFKGFNTGVYLFNCRYWREHKLTDLCKKIIVCNLKKKFMTTGTQPLLNLVFLNKTKNIDYRWNVAGAGWCSGLNDNDIKNAFIIHWSGRQKPWLRDGLWKNYWNKYNIYS